MKEDDTLAGRWYWHKDPKVSNKLDHARHRGRINVAFVDGHCESLTLPNRNDPDDYGDLDRVGVSRGVWW